MAFYAANPWEDDDRWLPPIDPGGIRANPIGPPILASSRPLPAPPANLPPPLPPPPIAPVGPPRGPTSLDALQELEARRPLSTDPQYQVSKQRKVLGNIAGAAAGAAAGFLNAGGRVRTDPNVGSKITAGIAKNPRLEKDTRAFEEKRQVLASQAKLDQERELDARKKSESEARIATEAAQKSAAEAAKARSERVTTPKLTERDPTKDLVDSTGRVVVAGTPKPPTQTQPQNWVSQALAIRRSDATPEEKERQIKQLEDDYKRFNPEKAAVRFVTAADGTVTAVRVTEADVAEAGGKKDFGKIGTGRAPRAATGTAAATRTAADEAALKLISDNGGDYDKAIAAAPSMAIRKAVQADRSRNKSGAGKASTGSKLAELLGIKVTTGGKPPSAAPTTAAAAGTPAKYKVGDVVEKGGKKYKVKAVRPDGKIDVDPI